jgi:hypothetical protein
MITLFPAPRLLLWLVVLLALGLRLSEAQVAATGLSRGLDSVTLDWQGGQGPFLVESTTGTRPWSAQGDLVSSSPLTLPGFAAQGLYRIVDLDPEDRHGGAFGLVQTDQGEFGGLLARHRLKTRLWFYTTKSAPHTSPTFTAAEYFRKLITVRQSLEQGRVRTWNGTLESLGTVTTPSSTRLDVAWAEGEGADQRTFLLSLTFPYSILVNRTKAPLASDPRYELSCTYASPQPEFDYDGTGMIISQTTLKESIDLYQLDPANGGSPFPAPRQYTVSKGGALIALHFIEGVPLLEGSPPFIWKTFILDRWLSPTTGSGGGLPAFSTDSWFARSLQPGHHNFFETVLLEPGLDPALSETTRAELKAANIRYIYTLKDFDLGLNDDDIRYVGFDLRLREP